MKQRVTIDDVARVAGVSRQTVSRAINNKGEISPDTRKLVMKTVQELGYRPSRVAQGLATQRTLTVGWVGCDLTNPFFPHVARGVQDIAQKNGYNLFLCDSDSDPKQELSILQSLADHAVDGIIIHPSYNSQETLTSFAAYYRPIVVINYAFEHPGVSQIMIDKYRGAMLAAEYLAGQGHSHIAMLTGIQNPSPDRVRRIQGFHEGLARCGLPLENSWLIPNRAPTFESGYESTRQFLKQQPQITAIFAYNDLLALGAIRACNELGYNVPADCAIIGFDDIQWATTSTPSLTTIRINKYELGQQAMIRLLAMIAEPDGVFPTLHQGVELVVRESA